MRTDSLDVSSLVSYINDIKPFHSKLTDVVIEYQANDNMYVSFTDQSAMAMRFSSVWELELVSDGRRQQYRIPAAVFPHYSDDFHQCERKGVTDEVPGKPGAYAVPYNNGVTVYLNGALQQKDVHYSIDEARTAVQFYNNLPKLGDVVCLNWAVVDRVFIGVNDVWQFYTLEYNSVGDGMDMLPYDAAKFDSSGAANPIIFENQPNVKLDPLGRVRVLQDSTGQDYYVFEFYNTLPLNTKIKIRVEQRETYNGWTQTSITDAVVTKDLVRFKDTVNAWIVDPGTWNVDKFNAYFDMAGLDTAPFDFSLAEETFGIDISSDRRGLFDSETFDIMDFDSIENKKQIGYWRLFNIKETLKDSFAAKVTDKHSDKLTLLRDDSANPKVTESRKLSIGLNEKDLTTAAIIDFDANNFDLEEFDTVSFDSVKSSIFSIRKTGPAPEQTATKIRENVSFIFDDGSGSFAIFSPDENGVIQVTTAVDTVQITHNYGYIPAVAVFLDDGRQFYPKSITFPSDTQVLVQFTKKMTATIRLA